MLLFPDAWSILTACNYLSAWDVPQRQTVQNSAARLLTKTKCSFDIDPVLASLHWLLNCLELILKFYSSLIRLYTDDVRVHHLNLNSFLSKKASQICWVRSTAVPQSRLRSKGDRVFAELSRLWISLPVSILSADTVSAFKACLKDTFLQTCLFTWQLVLFILHNTALWCSHLISSLFCLVLLVLHFLFYSLKCATKIIPVISCNYCTEKVQVTFFSHTRI